MIEVMIGAAVLCVASECFPALTGRATPVGEFTLRLLQTDVPAYRGDVLEFAREGNDVYAIHRPPSPRRAALLARHAHARSNVTDGCINVADAVYERLRQCCIGAAVRVTP